VCELNDHERGLLIKAGSSSRVVDISTPAAKQIQRRRRRNCVNLKEIESKKEGILRQEMNGIYMSSINLERSNTPKLMSFHSKLIQT
jgi:hypothetical protein